MKKTITKFVAAAALLGIVFFNNASAASAVLTSSKTSAYVGDSFTINVKVNAAAWNIHTSASGPVSGCVINQADASSDAMDTTKNFSATCKATGTGKITVSLSGDVTSANGDNKNIGGNVSITVATKPAPKPTTSSKSSNNKTTQKTTQSGQNTKTTQSTTTTKKDDTSSKEDNTDSEEDNIEKPEDNIENPENNIEPILTEVSNESLTSEQIFSIISYSTITIETATIGCLIAYIIRHKNY